MHGSLDHGSTRVHRVVRRLNDWTLKEHEIVVSHWPNVAAIRRRLPHRTVNAIETFAGKCNLRRSIHVWTQRQDSLLRKRVSNGVPRQAIADELGLSLTQVANRMNYAKIRYARRPLGRRGNDLIDLILERAFHLNMTRRDLDEACHSGSAFAKWSPARKIDQKHLLKAVRFLGRVDEFDQA